MAAAGGAKSALPAALTDGFHSAFLAGAGFAIVGLIGVLVLIRGRDSRAHVELNREPAAARSGA